MDAEPCLSLSLFPFGLCVVSVWKFILPFFRRFSSHLVWGSDVQKVEFQSVCKWRRVSFSSSCSSFFIISCFHQQSVRKILLHSKTWSFCSMPIISWCEIVQCNKFSRKREFFKSTDSLIVCFSESSSARRKFDSNNECDLCVAHISLTALQIHCKEATHAANFSTFSLQSVY